MSSITGLTELEDLRLYIQERVQEFDASIDTEIGSTFDAEVIQPLLSRLGPDPYNTPLLDFIITRLTNENPELVVQDGEPIIDTVVNPIRLLLEPFRRQIRQISNNQSFADPTVLNESEADNLGANFFVRRQQGGFAVGIARVYFSAPQFALVTPSNPVSTANGLQFFPVENQSISAENMLFNVEDNLYYFDIVVRAESQGEDYNIPANTLVAIDGLPASVKVTNRRAFEEGAARESTEEFVERIENSLTEKSLVTVRGIGARLTDVFESIRLIQVIGFGDPEMNRDILKGTSQSQDYAFFTASTPAGPDTPELNLDLGYINDGTPGNNDFVEIGVEVGDIVTYIDTASQTLTEVTVTEISAAGQLQVSPNLPGGITQEAFSIRKDAGLINLSDIPGGILVPNTPNGTIQINDGEVHIGGALDVFVRGGDPQEQNTTLEGILDGEPLHFGLDLESFGDANDRVAQVTRTMESTVAVPANDRFGIALATRDEMVVLQELDQVDGLSLTPWKPTEEDIGRFVQVIGGVNEGTFEITDVVGEELYGTPPRKAVRIKLDLLNIELGTTISQFTATAGYDEDIRIVVQESIKDRVRDRDGSTTVVAEDFPQGGDPEIVGGIDYEALGVDIGDSVVIETGDDAGIFSVRRVLSWLAENDTLILDRELTRTVTPLGDGSGTGLRYRIADSLDVDLVEPKVTKIPLGNLFTGNDLSTVAGSDVVSVSGSTDFLLAGVEAGDTLEILTGDNAGQYQIISVTSSTVQLDSPVLSTSFAQSFTVFLAFSGVERPLVRVKEVELLDSSSQPTGIKIPYGKDIDARILGTLSNRAQGSIVSSFTGEITTGVLFRDDNRDFVSEDVEPGYRINIINGLSAGSYTITKVGAGDGLADNNTLEIVAEADGGKEFRTAESDLQYSIGLPSAGIARLYFLEPTSIEIATGIGGGRIQYQEIGGQNQSFQFSAVAGAQRVPSSDSTGDNPVDLRVVRSEGVARTLTGDQNDGSTTSGSAVFTDADATFITDGVESTDVLRITAGPNVGVYNIGSVDSETQLTISSQTFGSTSGANTYQVERFETIVELTDPARPGVFELEIQNGDVIEINEEIPTSTIKDGFSFTWNGTNTVTVGASPAEQLRSGNYIRLDSDGNWFRVVSVGATTVVIDDDGVAVPSGTGASSAIITLKQAGVFGQHAGLRTQAASNLVTIPDNSLVDFVAMNTLTPLVGQILVIESGPDEGRYSIESVASSKSLRLSKLMTGTTETILGADVSTPRDATLSVNVSNTDLTDATDNGALGTLPGQFIQIFESIRPEVEGVFEIASYPDPNTAELSTSITNPNLFNDPFSNGSFSWLRVGSDALVEQPFRIYQAAPTEVTVTEVASKRPDPISGVRRGDIGSATILTDGDPGADLAALGAAEGDLLEVLAGPSAGTYFIESVVGDTVTIRSHTTNDFPVTVSDVPYRIWSGLHGSRRMLTVSAKDSFSGLISSGLATPYRILRPEILRVSSTEMENNFDGSLYYVDVQIESDGSGNEFNLSAGERLVTLSGLSVDGYTYSVDNNTLTFSTFEETFLRFSRRFLPVGNSDSPENLTEISGRNLRIVYESSTTARLVNDLLRSATERPVNANPIARHFLPSYVYSTVRYSGGVSAQEAGQEMEDYINSLGATDELEVSDLHAILTRRGANSIRNPQEIVTVTHDIDRALVVNRSNDLLGGSESVPYNGTGRISAFFTELGETLLVERES